MLRISLLGIKQFQGKKWLPISLILNVHYTFTKTNNGHVEQLDPYWICYASPLGDKTFSRKKKGSRCSVILKVQYTFRKTNN